MTSEHRMGGDTKKLVLVAKGVNRSIIVLFCFKKKKNSISRERHTGVFTNGMIQSLGFPLEFASKEMKEEGREGRHMGVGMEEG